jgi:hypothetical protein
MPNPMPAMTTRSLGGTAQFRPNADALTMEGKATTPAMAAGAVVRNVRRLYLRVVFIESFSREGAGTRQMTAAILPHSGSDPGLTLLATG